MSTDNAAPSDYNVAYHALNVKEEQVTVPPLSSVIISIGTKAHTKLLGVIEGDQHLLLNRQMRVARGISKLHNRETNGNELQQQILAPE